MERLTYVTEKGEVLFHPEDLPDDEGVTITQLAKDGRFKALEIIAERLANYEQVEKHGSYGKWIPVSERLPNEYEFIKSYRRNKYAAEFIVMIKGANRPTTLYFTHNGWWTDNMKDRYDVTAWMPLPEPYRESEPHKQTKADEIRSMTDEELAAFIINFDNRFGEEYEGEQSCLAWLQKESEETK